MENGEDEEDETLEDSFEEQADRPTVQLRTAGTRKPPLPEGRAPTMTIEMVRVGRPKKVLAIIAAVISLILFVSCLASTSWVFTETQRIGLFQRCQIQVDPKPEDNSECSLIQLPTRLDWKTWHSLACIFTGAIVLLFMLLGIVLFVAGTLSLVVRTKMILYKIVLALHIIAVLLMATCLVLFPIGCWLWGTDGSFTTISIGWPIYVGCVGIVLLIVSIALLITDRKSEEVAYKEIISRS